MPPHPPSDGASAEPSSSPTPPRRAASHTGALILQQLEAQRQHFERLAADLTSLREQVQALHAELAARTQERGPLGLLDEASHTGTLFVKDKTASLWHLWKRGAQTEAEGLLPQTATRLRCYVTGIHRFLRAYEDTKFEDKWKLDVRVRAGEITRIQSGFDSAFSRGLLAQIATLGHRSPGALARPVVIEIARGTTQENVVLCQLTDGDGELVTTLPYRDRETERLFRAARRALGQEQDDANELRERERHPAAQRGAGSHAALPPPGKSAPDHD